MSTLTLKEGTCWACTKHNGRVAFEHNTFAIHFVPQTGFFHFKEREETVFVAKTPAECLASSHEVMMECHASKFVPIWEQP